VREEGETSERRETGREHPRVESGAERGFGGWAAWPRHGPVPVGGGFNPVLA
jgi:hypothetical protein